MQLYQIEEITQKFNHAGSKATADIADIAESMGFKRVKVVMKSYKLGLIPKVKRQISYYFDFKKAYKVIEENSIVLLQHPFIYPQLTREKTLLKLKSNKNVRFISVVHDVEELRADRYNEYFKNEFEFMLNITDVLIVHNDIMKQFFIGKGVSPDKIITLKIFDYLMKYKSTDNKTFERSITVAGNLSPTKSPYIKNLTKLENIKINLFGPQYDETMGNSENVIYHGSFQPDEIPSKLNSGFGLVWDGNSIETCSGGTGEYLKYNNPHKLSLYIASGLPVIIWSKAAEAEFVKNNNLGICVESLYDLNDIFKNIDEDKYADYCKSTKTFSANLLGGFYTKSCLSEAISKLS